MYIPFDFAALSKRNESNLKEEEEKIKFRRANEKNENSKRGKKFFEDDSPSLFFPVNIFAQKLAKRYLINRGRSEFLLARRGGEKQVKTSNRGLKIDASTQKG